MESRDAHRLAAPSLCDCCIALPLRRTRRAGRGKTLKIFRLVLSPILLAELFHGVYCTRSYDILIDGAHSYPLARERIHPKKCEGEEMDTVVRMLDQFRDSTRFLSPALNFILVMYVLRQFSFQYIVLV